MQESARVCDALRRLAAHTFVVVLPEVPMASCALTEVVQVSLCPENVSGRLRQRGQGPKRHERLRVIVWVLRPGVQVSKGIPFPTPCTVSSYEVFLDRDGPGDLA